MPSYNTKSEVSEGRNIYRNQYKETSKLFNFGHHLLFIWGGSCLKLIRHDILIWVVLYTLLSLLYRCVLCTYEDPNPHREMFELLCIYAERFSGLLPITFITGFYVSNVVSRWWDQFMSLPWPDTLAMKLAANIPNGTDDYCRNLRRQLMRYVNLSNVLVYRLVTRKVEERFPNEQSLVDANLMLPDEAEKLKKCKKNMLHEMTWLPIMWALKLLSKARRDKKIEIEAPMFCQIQSRIEEIEKSNRKILNYGWVNFPLAYTQVAHFSVKFYFFAALFGRQYLMPHQEDDIDTKTFPSLNDTISFATSNSVFKPHSPDLYIPFFTLFELFAYLGWIKVAESLLNPFGDDDEDFQLNYLIDRNISVSYMIVDDPEPKESDLSTDPFLNAGIEIPKELPYQTPLLQRKRKGSIFGSSVFMNKVNDQEDNLSRASSVVSLAKATANTMVNKKPLKNFKKHFRPITSTKYTKVKRNDSAKNANLINENKTLNIDIPTHFYDLSSTAPVPGSNAKDGKFAFPDPPSRAKSATTITLVNENKCDNENVDELTQNLLAPNQGEENSSRLSNNLPTFTIEEEEEDQTGSTNGSKENVA